MDGAGRIVEGHALHLRPDGARGLVNYLDPEAVKRFIGLTYEKYYVRFPRPVRLDADSAFYDEPTMHWLKRPGLDARIQSLLRRDGCDPALLILSLWFDIGREKVAGNALFGFCAELYADGYVKTVQDWCPPPRRRPDGPPGPGGGQEPRGRAPATR